MDSPCVIRKPWKWPASGVQVLGGLVVLVGVALAQASRRADDDRVPDPPL